VSIYSQIEVIRATYLFYIVMIFRAIMSLSKIKETVDHFIKIKNECENKNKRLDFLFIKIVRVSPLEHQDTS
jgi:hypothetical protein